MRLLFLVIVWAAWPLMPGYALPTDAQRPESAPNPAHMANGHPGEGGRATGGRGVQPPAQGRPAGLRRDHGPARAMIPLPKRAGPNAARHGVGQTRNLPLSRSGSAANLRPPIGQRAGNGIGRPLAVNPGAHNFLPVGTAGAARPGAPVSRVAPHRSPNSAVVTGLVNSRRRSNGSINGTHVGRRP